MKMVTYVNGTDLIKLPENYLPSESTLGIQELNQLKPYLTHFMILRAEHLKNEKLCIHHNGNRAGFQWDKQVPLAHQALLTLNTACAFFLGDKVTVPEFRGKEKPLIHHRIFRFEIEDDQMFVKYVTLGAPNHFEAAMLQIQSIYPTVTPYDEEEGKEVEDNKNIGLLQEELDEFDESLEALELPLASAEQVFE